MSYPEPNVGPKPENLKIASDGCFTAVLNGPRCSLFRSEKTKALEVEPKVSCPLDSVRQNHISF